MDGVDLGVAGGVVVAQHRVVGARHDDIAAHDARTERPAFRARQGLFGLSDGFEHEAALGIYGSCAGVVIMVGFSTVSSICPHFVAAGTNAARSASFPGVTTTCTLSSCRTAADNGEPTTGHWPLSVLLASPF